MSLIEWIASVLGEYTPVTYEVYRVAGDTEVYDTVVASGMAGVDWPYVLTALFLIVCVWSVFRILGMLMEVFKR